LKLPISAIFDDDENVGMVSSRTYAGDRYEEN